jgi:hypothetical protein
MHASVIELLNLRDSKPLAGETARHVAGCPHCTSELERVTALRARLRSLPEKYPQKEDDEALWQRIESSLERHPGASQSPNRYLALAAGFVWAAVALVWFVVASQDSLESPAAVQRIKEPVLDALVVQSQQLENYLQQLPRPRVEQAATAATVDALEGRIQWLDYALSATAEAEVPVEQSEALWQERVDLLGSLVTLRYAQAERLSF